MSVCSSYYYCFFTVWIIPEGLSLPVKAAEQFIRMWRDTHWSYCGWQEGTSLDEVMLNRGEIKPVAIAIIELRFSEGISKRVSQSVSRLVENLTK